MFVVLVPDFDEAVRHAVVVCRWHVFALVDENTHLVRNQAAFRQFAPVGVQGAEVDAAFLRGWHERHLDLNHAGLVGVLHLTDAQVVFENEPPILRVGIQELSGIPFPEADRSVAIHQVDEDLIHLLDALVVAFERLLGKPLRPTVVAFPVRFSRLVRFQFKCRNFDLDFKFFFVREGNALAHLTDHIVGVIR